MSQTNIFPMRQAINWTPTRAAGLIRLEAFLPNAGYAYARTRNVDRGPDDRSNVSALSPWIRRRMITEAEVVAAVLERHSLAAAEKFIQELFWRTYWNGWLEMRPGIWDRFNQEHGQLSAALVDDRKLAAAMRGETGIDAFDHWARELVDTGWLHNHARMWFASIWIFTLRLPWQLGARFFYNHLLDADPASNTLSWRWVAGLHTRGKHYLARASNIHDNTLGRFDRASLLDESAPPLTEEELSLPALARPLSGGRPTAPRIALLLTEEDLHPESWPLEADIIACAALAVFPVHSSSPADEFSTGALADALARAQSRFGAEGRLVAAGEIADWARSTGAAEIVTGFAPVGPIARYLDAAEPRLQEQGQRLVRLQRDWDKRAWPLATAGFFKMKAQIPKLLADSGLILPR